MHTKFAIPNLPRAILAGTGAWILWLSGAIDPFDRVVADASTYLRPYTPTDTPFVVVAMDDATLDRSSPLPWPRDRLAELVDAAWASGAVAVALDLVLPSTGDLSEDVSLARALAQGPSVITAALLPESGFVGISPSFLAVSAVAHPSAEVSPDGVVRRFRSTLDDGSFSFPALSLSLAQLVDRTIPTEVGTWIRPGFPLPPDRVPQISAHRLLRDPGAVSLEGRVAIIGVTAAGASDQFVVSAPRTRGPRPGVVIHAAAAHSILSKGLLSGPPGWVLLPICWLAGSTAWLLRKQGHALALRELAVGTGTISVLATVALWGLDWALPTATIILAFGSSLFLLESADSSRVARETHLLLAKLLEHSETDDHSPAAEGLQLARRLQAEVMRDRDLRRRLLESLDEGVVLWDAEGEVLLSNRAAERLWGGPPEGGALRASETLDESEPLVSRGDRFLRVRGWEVEGGHLSVIRDRTSQKALEDRKREMQRLVSHELKSPLASISGFGSMLRRYSLSREETERVASLVQTEADRLLNMVMTFLDLDRLGAHQPGDRVPVELEACLRRRLELLEVVAKANGQELVLSTDSLPSTILAIETLVERVLDNLVSNALKYSGGDSRVEIWIARAADWLEIRVSDQGPGVPEEALPRLFDRFYRVPGTSSPGSGLGLAVVREITEWHGGCVGVESQLNEGSSFWVRFPVIDSGRVAP